MMATARMTSFMLFFLAVGALSWDVMPMLQGAAFKLSSWGDLWYGVHPESLHTYKVVVEQYVSAGIWDKVLAPLLGYKAVFVFAFPAVSLVSLPFMADILNLIFEGTIAS